MPATLVPRCAVIVCTVRSTKLHSGEAPKVVPGARLGKEYTEENLHLVKLGSVNLVAHINNVRAHGVQVRRHGRTIDECCFVAPVKFWR